MQIFALLVLFATTVAPSLAENFHFTGPDTNEKLNLAAPITVQWVTPPDGPEATAYQLLDLWWGGYGFRYELVENLTLAVGPGEWVWNPKNVTDSLMTANYTLPPGREYFFEARMRATDSMRGARVQSDKYEVEGYALIGGGQLLLPGWNFVVAVLIVTSILVA